MMDRLGLYRDSMGLAAARIAVLALSERLERRARQSPIRAERILNDDIQRNIAAAQQRDRFAELGAIGEFARMSRVVAERFQRLAQPVQLRAQRFFGGRLQFGFGCRRGSKRLGQRRAVPAPHHPDAEHGAHDNAQNENKHKRVHWPAPATMSACWP